MNNNIHKIWGNRKRILINDLVEIDHLEIKKNYCCSVHRHRAKVNRFYMISGKVKIKTEYGETILKAGESMDVFPPLKHQFIALEDSVMIECAYIKIDENDIQREKQGGKIVNGQHITLEKLNDLSF